MNRMTDRIRRLEKAARELEFPPEARRRITESVFTYAGDFLDRIELLPAFIANAGSGEGLYESPIGEEPTDIDSILDLIRVNVDEVALNPASGGHLGYIPGGGIYPSALGDYLADVTNRYAGVYYVGPGSVRMEHMLVRWMGDLVGYPDSAAGDLTSGGSIANLVGIVTARDAHGLRGSDIERSVVYLTSQAHHSLFKALRIAGLGECVIRRVDLDHRYRMQPESLESHIVNDRRAGLNPWLVITSAGTTDTGSVDPLGDVSRIAEEHELWHHVDAAYGGFFLLCDHGRTLMAGIDRSDSVVIDPHKGLFLPYGTGGVLVKERQRLQASHYCQANYMQDATEALDEYSPSEHSPELTRHFRGLRMWLPLKLFGLAPFRACLEEKLLLARHFYNEIQTIDGFEVGPDPDLSVVTYRYVPRKGDVNEFNRRIVREVQRDGRVFISSTTLDGKVTLRTAVLCFRAHLSSIETLLDVLRETVRLIERDG